MRTNNLHTLFLLLMEVKWNGLLNLEIHGNSLRLNLR